MTQPETLLIGRGARIERVPALPWRQELGGIHLRMRGRLAFMTPEHRAVREAAVRLLPAAGRPLSAAQLSETVGIEETRAAAIVEDLHRNLFFLVRNSRGEVSWAYPVTVDRTPHHLTFSSGERLWGA